MDQHPAPCPPCQVNFCGTLDCHREQRDCLNRIEDPNDPRIAIYQPRPLGPAPPAGSGMNRGTGATVVYGTDAGQAGVATQVSSASSVKATRDYPPNRAKKGSRSDEAKEARREAHRIYQAKSNRIEREAIEAECARQRLTGSQLQQSTQGQFETGNQSQFISLTALAAATTQTPSNDPSQAPVNPTQQLQGLQVPWDQLSQNQQAEYGLRWVDDFYAMQESDAAREETRQAEWRAMYYARFGHPPPRANQPSQAQFDQNFSSEPLSINENVGSGGDGGDPVPTFPRPQYTRSSRGGDRSGGDSQDEDEGSRGRRQQSRSGNGGSQDGSSYSPFPGGAGNQRPGRGNSGSRRTTSGDSAHSCGDNAQQTRAPSQGNSGTRVTQLIQQASSLNTNERTMTPPPSQLDSAGSSARPSPPVKKSAHTGGKYKANKKGSSSSSDTGSSTKSSER